MPREKAAYRDNLERLDEIFPGKEALTYKEIASYLGRCENTIRKVFKPLYIESVGISKVTLARHLS